MTERVIRMYDKVISIEHLKKYYKEVKAVDDISFSVRRGELFAFLGLNGAGKSTTINILCGIAEKDDGKIYVCGIDTDKEREAIKPLLGVVFQNSVLDSRLSGIDNLRTRAAMYGITGREFEDNLYELSESLELADILRRPLVKLSGGQKRRMDIARALIHKPEILILDEPTTGLDPKTRILVWRLLAELRRKRGLTIILTTHYMEEADEADEIVVIDAGKIVAHDTPVNLKNDFADDMMRIYAFKTEFPAILQADGVQYVKGNSGLEIKLSDTEEAKTLLMKYSDFIFDFEVIKGNLDSVFVNVTGKSLKENLTA